jgi:hypothetical protein
VRSDERYRLSYPYRVVVSRSVETTVNAKDKSTQKVSLTTILPEKAMKDLLKDALVKRGWKEKEGEPGKLEREKDGMHQTIDLATLTVETEVSVTEKIKKEKSVEVVGDAYRKDDIETEKDRLRARAGAELEKQLAVSDDEKDEKKRALERAIAEKLSGSDEERKKDLNETLLEVYAEALKKKAASLGNVTSVKEERKDGGREYELTIKVAE